MSITYYIVSLVVVSIHSFLNFTLCSRFSDSARFHKFSIYLACAVNGVIAPFIITTNYINPMTPYLVCTVILSLELLFLYKGKLNAIFGVVIGSLLHLFVLRHIFVAITSIVNGISMTEVIFSSEFISMVNLSAFAAQLVTLSLFIKLIPLKTLSRVMADKSFYNGLLSLALFLAAYIIYSSYIFLVDYFSVNLAVQVIVISLLVLAFLYIMMLFLIKIFNLGIYKDLAKELEDQIDKDKTLTSAVFNFAEIIIEANCSKDKITRIVVNSVERPIEHIPPLAEFFKKQTSSFTHPEDITTIRSINIVSLISDFESGVSEKMFEFRSKSIMATDEDTGVEVSSDDYLWYRLRVSISRDKETSDIIALFTVDEIDEEKRAELLLLKQAQTDPLTGAYNKNTFITEVEEHLNDGSHGTLYMLDLDNFKGINDNMGHSAGDAVLCEVFAKISTFFRPHDIIARAGGDEFVIFLLGTTKTSTIERKARQICEGINKTYYAENGISIEISASVGISTAPNDGNDFKSLFNAADVAMYHSKNLGKNTFTIYNSSLESGYKPREKDDFAR